MKIFFIHVPKTGGQTLATRLASAFLTSETWILRRELFYPNDIALFEKLRETMSLIESHVAGEILRDTTGLDLLTTVREPVSQMISNYRHMRRAPINVWHRAASTLSPDKFLDNFGDFFTNHQTQYILQSFFPIQREITHKGYNRALYDRLYEAVERIRWIVPTESIDEFTMLWQHETKRKIPSLHYKTNEAPLDDYDIEAMRAAIVARPHLYAFDALLWQVAQEQFATYKTRVSESLSPWHWPNNSRRAFFDGNSGIWLLDNWYDPEFIDGTLAYWSGPRLCSTARIKRTEDLKVLSFNIPVVHGIDRNEISAFCCESKSELETTRFRRSDEITTYCINIEKIKNNDIIELVVPRCMSPIMTGNSSDSLRRLSFIGSNWALTRNIAEVIGKAPATRTISSE